MEKLYNKNIGFIYGIAPYEDGEPYDPFEYLMPDKLTVSTDKIAYHNICLELLKELFEELPKKEGKFSVIPTHFSVINAKTLTSSVLKI